MNFLGMGPMEVLVIMVVALIIFGPGKLPEIGAQVGKAVRDFRSATSDLTAEFQDSIQDMQDTMGEMRASVTDMQRETEGLAKLVPSGQEISGSTQLNPAKRLPNGAAPTSSQTDSSSLPLQAIAATSVADQSAAEASPARVPSKADPLADFGGSDNAASKSDSSD